MEYERETDAQALARVAKDVMVLEGIVKRLAACESDEATQIQFLPLITAAREYLRLKED